MDAEVVKLLNGLTGAVGRIEGQLNQLVSDGGQRLEAVEEDVDKHDERLRKVEGRQHWYAGVGAAVAILVDKFLPGITFGHST